MMKAKYVLDFQKSIIFDYFRALSWGYNFCEKDRYTNSLGFRIPSDPKVIEAFGYLWTGINKKGPGLISMLAETPSRIKFLIWKFEVKNSNLKSVDHFLEVFKKYPSDILIQDILCFYDSSEKAKDFYINLVKDHKALITFVETLKIDSAVKWDIINLVFDTENVKNNVLKALIQLHENVKKVYVDNSKRIKHFFDEISNKINNQGDQFFYIEEHPSWTYRKLYDRCEYITVTISFLAEVLVVFNFYETNKLFVTFGINYHKTLYRNNTERWNKVEPFICAMSDDTRQKIYGMIYNNEMFTSEIGEKLGVVPSTMGYHMDVFEKVGMLQKNFVGKWIYYIIDKQKVVNILNELRNCLLEGSMDFEL